MSMSKLMGIERKKARPKNPLDFHPTPEDATRAFVLAEIDRLRELRRIWEPAVGRGHIARVLDQHGLPVGGSDMVDRGYPGTVVQNFLDFEQPLGDGVVTNPPFGRGLPARFVLNCLRLKVPYCAMLLKGNYLHQKRALRLVSRWAPARHLILSFRPDFTGEGRSPWTMTWFVWDAYATSTEVHILPRPTADGAPSEPDLFESAA